MTQEQLEVVESTANNILVLAGAGAGKTSVLIARVRRILDSGVHPNRIVCITYTNAAAGELAKRLAPIQLGVCSTLHGFCVKVLKQFGPSFGLPPKFGILSEQQTKDLIDETAAEMRYKGSKVALLDAVENFPRLKSKQQLAGPTLVAAAFYGTLAKNNLLTFDLVLYKGLEVLRQIAAEPTRAWRYTHLSWDEIQDSSDVDLAILDAMPMEEKLCVGDFRQSIMGFRGSNWEGCREYFLGGVATKWTSLCLTTNFRSDIVIINAANRLMAGDGQPDMVGASAQNGMVGLAKYPTGEREIVGVADVIQSVLAKRPQTSVGVLLRTNALVTLWKRGLEDMGLKVFSRVVSLPVDWQMVLTYLSLLVDPDNDWLAYKTLVAFRGQEVADELRSQALAKLQTINQVALGIPSNVGIALAVQKLATVASAEAMLIVNGIVSTSPPEMEVADLLLAAQRVSFPEQEQPGVVVSTIHGGKGLEWDLVAIPACEDGVIPLKASDEDEERRLLYVGMTRARHILQISYAEQRRNPFTGQHEPTKRSRFLDRIAQPMESGKC